MSTTPEKLLEIVEELVTRFNADIYEFRGEASLIVQPGQIHEVCRILRDEYDFVWLVAQTAVDYWPKQSPRFHVIYQIRSISKNLIIGLRVPLNGDSPQVPTIEDLYRNANWFEREIWDMFGINIIGHSDLRRILMPHDWEGHPLRKDFPLGYEEVQFSFNFDEIEKRKRYVEE